MAHADMAERIDDAFVGQNAIGGNQLVDQRFQLGHLSCLIQPTSGGSLTLCATAASAQASVSAATMVVMSGV
jgi:hypothetical protein